MSGLHQWKKENEKEIFSPSPLFSIKLYPLAVTASNHRASFIAQLQLHPLLLFRASLPSKAAAAVAPVFVCFFSELLIQATRLTLLQF